MNLSTEADENSASVFFLPYIFIFCLKIVFIAFFCLKVIFVALPHLQFYFCLNQKTNCLAIIIKTY